MRFPLEGSLFFKGGGSPSVRLEPSQDPDSNLYTLDSVGHQTAITATEVSTYLLY